MLTSRAVVVAQLVERLLPIPEVRGSNPVIGKIYIHHLLTVNCIEKKKTKKKEAGNGPFKKRTPAITTQVITRSFGHWPQTKRGRELPIF